VLDDAMLSGQSPERFARVLGPKADGAWNLHAYFATRPEVHLVLFSSVVSLLGLPGQANYAAANAYLDALAHRRRAEGGRGTSINWGPWAEVGMAAGRTDRGVRLADRGLPSLTVHEGLTALERVLEDGRAEVAVMHFDRAAYVDAYPSAAASVLLPKPASSQDSAPADFGAAPSLRDALSALPPGRRRRDAIEQRVKEAVGRVLREAASKIDRDKPFRSLGLDSLMGLELRNRLEGETGLALPATIVWNYPTVAALAGHLGERLGIPLEPAAFANGHGADSTAAVVSAELADGDTTLEAMLAEIEQLSPEAASRQLSDED
jgi:acyl carrier protein